jgi:signal transduction histidine kinase
MIDQLPPITQPSPLKQLIQKRFQILRSEFWATKPSDGALALLYCAILGMFIMRHILQVPSSGFPWWRLLGISLTITVLLGLERLEYWRFRLHVPIHFATLTFALRVVLIELFAQLDGSDGIYFLYLSLPFSAALLLGNWIGLGVGVLVYLRFALGLLFEYPSWSTDRLVIENLLIYPVGIAFVLTMAQLVTTERKGRLHTEKLFRDLEESHAQLSNYAAQIEMLTLTAERNRVAREIHDSLGHYLTAINIQLRKATAFRSKDPAQAEQALEDAKRLTHNALDDVRRSVGLLRASEPAFELVTSLHSMIAPFQSEHLAIGLTVENNEDGYTPATLMALYRGAQEGLTNIQRHAHANQAQLGLTFGPKQATLMITDNGVGFNDQQILAPQAGQRSGYGLLGIRERMELVGGTMAITSQLGHGTTLTLTVPKVRPGIENTTAAITTQEVAHEHAS